MIYLPVGKGKTSYNEYPALPFFYIPSERSHFLLSILFFSLLLMVGGGYITGDEVDSPLPAIKQLDSRDMVFKQYLQDVESSRRLLFSFRQSPSDHAAAEKIAASMTIYSYTFRDQDELMAVAARCIIPYAALASLNRFSHAEDITAGKILLLPSVPGIFVPEKPGSDLERLISAARADTGENGYGGVALSVPREGRTERFRFIPGDDFNPTERIYFLNRGFHFPLQNFQVSSFYGPRINPVTGKASIHGGVDLAAPEGAEVYAVRNGTVMDLGEDPVLGKYIIISHENNWISLYGHLSSINTVLRSELQSGSLIARVGSTGQSTGPHLHFELRQNGQTRDPARLLGIFKGNAGR